MPSTKMPSNISLTISGKSHLLQGIYSAANLKDYIKLVFYSDEEVIAETNLAADRTSLYRSEKATKAKIHLFCERLGIDEQQLNYDRSLLSKEQKIGYKFLFLKKMLFEAFIPAQWCIVYKKTTDTEWHKIIPDSKPCECKIVFYRIIRNQPFKTGCYLKSCYHICLFSFCEIQSKAYSVHVCIKGDYEFR